MTKRLYWKYPEGTTFTAKFLRASPCMDNTAESEDKGVFAKVWLDQTLFYPKGGGQPYDTGLLRIEELGLALPVTKVLEEDNDIVHYVCCPLDKSDDLLSLIGKEVCGEINWKRRFDHMQQHTGQHILTPAFSRVIGAKTTGFHLSQDYASIDLDVAEITLAQAKEVEQVANEVVFSDVPVKAEEYKPGELLPSVRRRLPKETDIIRVVEIGDYDACACGGTHVISTGQVGLIKVCETARAHGGVRVIYRCGWRALADYQQKNESVRVCARLLSVAADDMDSGVSSLLAKLQEEEQEIKRLQKAFIELEAQVLTKEARERGSLFVRGLSGKKPDELRWLAKEVAARSGQPVIIFVRDPRFAAAIASPVDTFDARAAAQSLTAAFEARGGGNKSLAQVGSKEALGLSDEEIRERILIYVTKVYRQDKAYIVANKAYS